MNPSILLKKHSLKVTKPREAVLNVLISSHLPLTINQIREQATYEMDLSTLYRTLDTFYENHLISKTVPLEPSQTIYEMKRENHQHYLICQICQTMTIIKGCPIHDYEHEVENTTGYIIEKHQLELYGICPKCQKTELNS